MANEQLRQALRNAGLEIDELAVKIGVDIKTAQRWLSGRTIPHQRSRWRVAQALGVHEHTLWPADTTTDQDDEEQEPEPGELIEVLTDPGQLDWRQLLTVATERVWLLDLTLAEVIAKGDELLLVGAGRRGCQVRILVSDRDSAHLHTAAQDNGDQVDLEDWPASTIELDRVVALLTPHAQDGEIELREFVGHGGYQVLIFDNQALVRLRLPGIRPDLAPVLYLTGEHHDGILVRFTEHFQAIWDSSASAR